MKYTEDGNETQVNLISCQDKLTAQCLKRVTEYIILNLVHIRKVTEMTLKSASKHPAREQSQHGNVITLFWG